MVHEPLKILFIGDTRRAAEQIRELLDQTDLRRFDLQCVSERPAVVTLLARNSCDVCIVDFTEQGTEFVVEARRVGSTVPIIALTDNSASEVLRAWRHGVMDCLVREIVTAAALEESICTVIERAQASESQAQHERCYLSLVENANDTIFTLDDQARWTFINRAGERLTGYSQCELLKMRFTQLIASEHVDFASNTIVQMFNDRKPAVLDTVLIAKNGERIPIRISAHLIYREGISIGVQGVAHRVTWQPASGAFQPERSVSPVQ